MSTPEPNHNTPSDEIEQVLSRARFRPDAGFEDRLHARLIEQMPEPEHKRWWQRLGELVMGNGDQIRDGGMRSAKLLPALSVGVLGLMLFLFVRLVLVKPTGFGDAPTPTVSITEEAHVDAAHVDAAYPVGMRFGGELDLTEALVERSGDAWTVTLWWQVVKQPQRDYTIALFAGDETQIVSQIDAPLTGADLLSSNSEDWNLPTSQWLQNRIIASTFTLIVPADGPEPTSISVEVHDPENNWTLTLEKDGYSLSTIRAGVWDASMGTPVAESTDEAVPDAQPTPVASGEVAYRAISLSADGKWLAVESQKPGEWPRIHAINIETREATFIADGAWPSLDADGGSVAFVIRPRTEVDPNWMRMNIINTAATDASAYFDVSSSVGLGEAFAMMPDLAESGAVAFLAQAANVEGMPPQPIGFDVYVYNAATGVLERIAPEVYGDEPYISAHPSISADGRYVAFGSAPTNLDLPLPRGIFVWDRQEKTLTHLGEGLFPEISGDGSTVAYLRFGGEQGQGEGWINALATNLITGNTRWLGRVLDAQPDGNWIERVFSLSHDGSRIAFWSVLGDPRGADIPAPEASGGLGSAYESRLLYVYDWNTDRLANHQPPFNSLGIVSNPVLSADGNVLAYIWQAGFGGVYHLMWADLSQGQVIDLSEELVLPEP